MFKRLRGIAFLVIILGLSGCAALGNMKQVSFETNVEPDSAMVNIVRRSVFMGDGADVEMWDGEKFIGTLKSGTLLQYKAKPGKHTFMAYVQGSWGVAQGELKAGKTYYLKSNLSGWGPISLGVAEYDDSRIGEWQTMETVVLDTSKPKEIPEKYLALARKTLKQVENGNINPTPITDRNAL